MLMLLLLLLLLVLLLLLLALGLGLGGSFPSGCLGSGVVLGSDVLGLGSDVEPVLGSGLSCFFGLHSDFGASEGHPFVL